MSAPDLLRWADDLEARLAALPKRPDRYWHDKAAKADFDARLKAGRDELVAHLTTRDEAPATVRERWDGATISMLGLRSTATGSLIQAMHNWIALARRKAAEGSAPA